MYKLLLCWRYLRTRWIALASIVSVTLGVATMIVVNSVMEGFRHEMQDRLHSILSDVVFESTSMVGFYNADWHMEQIRAVAGDDIQGMTATVVVPALLNYQFNDRWITRPVQVIGIDEHTQSQMGDFGKYLQHPENRQELSFALRPGGYDIRDHQAGPEAPERPDMSYAGWEHRRRWAQRQRILQSMQPGSYHDPNAQLDPFIGSPSDLTDTPGSIYAPNATPIDASAAKAQPSAEVPAGAQDDSPEASSNAAPTNQMRVLDAPENARPLEPAPDNEEPSFSPTRPASGEVPWKEAAAPNPLRTAQVIKRQSTPPAPAALPSNAAAVPADVPAPQQAPTTPEAPQQMPLAPSDAPESEGAPPPQQPFAEHDAPAPTFDPSVEQHVGAVLGIGLTSFRDRDGKDRFLALPGDDVKLSFPTAGTPPELSHASFTIVDFYESKMSEYDASFVFVPLKDLQQLRGMFDPSTGIGYATSIQIKLKPGCDGQAVRDKLREQFAPQLYNILTWRDKQGPLLAAVRMETAILNVLLFLIIAVAGFGILAIFYMIVVEKTRDIGILKSLGASGHGILGIFLGYGLLLGIVGAGAGLAIGLLFVAYINEIADVLAMITGQEVFDPSIYYFQQIPTIVQPFTVTWIVLGALTIAVLASVLPARRAARLHPVEALRYE